MDKEPLPLHSLKMPAFQGWGPSSRENKRGLFPARWGLRCQSTFEIPPGFRLLKAIPSSLQACKGCIIHSGQHGSYRRSWRGAVWRGPEGGDRVPSPQSECLGASRTCHLQAITEPKVRRKPGQPRGSAEQSPDPEGSEVRVGLAVTCVPCLVTAKTLSSFM